MRHGVALALCISFFTEMFAQRTQASLLRHIGTTAQKLSYLLTPLGTSSQVLGSVLNLHSDNDESMFPNPLPLDHYLPAELDSVVVKRLSDVYMKAALRLRVEYYSQYKNASRAVHIGRADSPEERRLQSRLLSTFSSVYTRTLRDWAKRVVEQLASHTKSSPPPIELRRSFNQVGHSTATDQQNLIR